MKKVHCLSMMLITTSLFSLLLFYLYFKSNKKRKAQKFFNQGLDYSKSGLKGRASEAFYKSGMLYSTLKDKINAFQCVTYITKNYANPYYIQNLMNEISTLN